MTGTPKPLGGSPPAPPAPKAKPPLVPPQAAAGAGVAPPLRQALVEPAQSKAGVPSPTIAGGARPKELVRPTKTTAEFLFELDAPTRPTSREMDFEANPEIVSAGDDAIAASNSETAGSALEPAQADEALDPLPPELSSNPSLDEVLALFAVSSTPATAEEQQQQRLRRTLLRVLTCRDCFRWMGSLGVADEDKKGIARMLMGLDTAIGPREGQASVVKDPETALEHVSPEQLDALERLIAPIEDRLLSLDELITPEIFQTQLENRKQSRKIIARYGRLLASRRFSAGQRRDRFELITTHLLTVQLEGGFRRTLPPERARAVLEHLIGGIPRRQREEQELGEALGYLLEMLDRLNELKSQDEFFETGYFLDVHGYKVSSRDQLLSPEFVYLSVLINVAVHNRLETWIGSMARLYDSHQLTSEGAPREHVMRRLRDQEEAIDDSFGVKRRTPLQARRSEPPKPVAPAKRTKPKKKAQQRFEIVFDRQFTMLALSVLVTLSSGIYLAFKTGAVGEEAMQALNADQLAQISPVLARGWILGSGTSRHFDGSVVRARWTALDARRRMDQAEHVTKVLHGKGIKNAKIAGPEGRVIEIHDGLVSFVQGGKL
jgi:hypothetical protein